MKRDSHKKRQKKREHKQRHEMKSKQSSSAQSGNIEFVYPYNFVPVMETQRREGFKPLHRYDGLTGRIHYKLKTLSPVFIPDPEGTTVFQLDKSHTDKIHKVMDFFNVNRRLCIPSTSIKGMVRNVVEAATNSSFGVFDCNNKKFAYRKDRGFRRNIGIYNNGQIIPAKLGKLPRKALEDAVKKIVRKTSIDFYDIAQFQDERFKIKLWKIHTGMPLVVEFQLRNMTFQTVTISHINSGRGSIQQRTGNNKKRMIVSNGKSYFCPWDTEVWSALKVNKDWPDKPSEVNFKYTDFPEIEKFDPGKGIGNNRVIEITVRNPHGVTNTWSGMSSSFIDGRLLLQRFFLDEEVRNSGIKMSDRYVYVVYDYSGSRLRLNKDVLKDYVDVNVNEPVNNQIVYYETDSSGNITEFGPVSMFKSAENVSLCDLVKKTTPSVLYPHSSADLCPATRLFGWTPEDESSNEQGIAGRVRFTTAWSNSTLSDTALVPLKILGGPKTKYYPFYLKAKDGSNRAGYYTLTSDNPWSQKEGVIRGRKFYLHHPCVINTKETNYIHIDNQNYSSDHKKEETWPHTNQNSSCRVLHSGAEFTGYIEFESLDEHELGMLLWCLTLSDNPFQSSQEHGHKIGMGKGIGMGSVMVEIKSVCIENPEKNWFELDSTDIDPEYVDGEDLKDDKLKSYVMAFKRWLLNMDGSSDDSKVNSEFQKKDFIADLLRILKLNLVDINTPIRYYSKHADKGFEYFMKQRAKRSKNEEETLKTPSEIESGQRQNG